MPSTELNHARMRVARAHRFHGPDSPEVVEARRDLAGENLAAYVSRVVADAPPLTDDQVARVAALLRPSADGAPPGRIDRPASTPVSTPRQVGQGGDAQ